MEWTNTHAFRAVCRLMLFVFTFQTAQPAAFGYLPAWLQTAGVQSGSATAARLLDFLIPSAGADEAPSDPWLASTVDANYNDRFIQDKLKEIGPGVEAAFAFVRDQIGNEVYTGSLRGARGTLWSKAGNSLDKASLLIALLRGQGIKARYVQGRLSDDQARRLIASMFDPAWSAQGVGYVPEEAIRADPAMDPQWLAEAGSHWWVELEDGRALDPTFQEGDPSGTADARHFAVPPQHQHRVTLRLRVEFQNMLAGFTDKIPLEAVFSSAELYGKPLGVAHFVDSQELSGWIGGFRTFNYLPYLVLDDGEAKTGDEHLIRGAGFQEFYNNLIAIANSLVTRETLEIELSSPDGRKTTQSRDLYDRIGYAARRGAVQPGPVNTESAALNKFDVTTVHIVSGLMDDALLQSEIDRYLDPEVFDLFAEVEPLLEKEDSALTAEEAVTVGRFEDSQISQSLLKTRMLTAGYLSLSDEFARETAETHLVKFYHPYPRVIIAQDLYQENADGSIGNRTALDLRDDGIRAIPYPGQNSDAACAATMTRGLFNNLVETAVVGFFADSDEAEAVPVSSYEILKSAHESGTEILVLRGIGDIPRLDGLDLSPEAKLRISAALSAGKVVTLPAAPVQSGGKPVVAWYENDLDTGEFIGVTADGGHQALAEYGLTNAARRQATVTALRQFAMRAARLSRVYAKKYWRRLLREVKKNWTPTTRKIWEAVATETAKGVGDGIVEGIYEGLGDTLSSEAQDAVKTQIRIALDESLGGQAGTELMGKLDDIQNAAESVDGLVRGSVDLYRSATDVNVTRSVKESFGLWPIADFLKTNHPNIKAGDLAKIKENSVLFARGQVQSGVASALLTPIREAAKYVMKQHVKKYVQDQAKPAVGLIVNTAIKERTHYPGSTIEAEIQKDYQAYAKSDLGKVISFFGSGSVVDLAGTDLEVRTLLALASPPTSPPGDGTGLAADLVEDPLFSVKAGGSRLPSAFRVRLRNGPAPGSYTLAGSAPPGWRLSFARSETAIPAGGSGEVSVFLRPDTGETSLPAPGTAVPLSLTVTRSGDPGPPIALDRQFVVPVVRLVRVEPQSGESFASPNGSARMTVAIRNAGNLAENPTLEWVLPPGLSAEGMPASVNLEPGASVQGTVVLTARGLELDQDYPVSLKVRYGEGDTAESRIIVHIAAPGSLEALDAVRQAEALGQAGMAGLLRGLGQDLSLLYRTPADPPRIARAAANLEALGGILDDPLLAGYSPEFGLWAETLRAAAPDTLESVLSGLGTMLANLDGRLAALANHGFDAALKPNSAVALPQTPTRFGLHLENKGREATTYHLALTGVPAGVTAQLSRTDITLPAGWFTSPGVSGSNAAPEVYVTLTQPAGQLSAFEFGVVVTVDGAPELTRTATGAFTARQELVQVVTVQPQPAYADPGAGVQVSARVLNAVNIDREALASYTVKDAQGQVLFTSAPTTANLTVLSSLDTFALPALDTTGYAKGRYDLAVTLTERDGSAIPGATGRGVLQIGQPIQATLSVDPQRVPAGDSLARVSLNLASTLTAGQGSIQPVGLLGSIGTANQLAVRQDHAYVCGGSAVSVVATGDPLNPALETTLAGAPHCALNGGLLLTSSDFRLTAYDLDDRAAPQQTGTVDSGLQGIAVPTHLYSQGRFAFLNTLLYGYTSYWIFVRGDTVIFDIDDPAHPVSLGLLFDTPQSQYPQWRGSNYYIGHDADGKDGVVYLPSASGTAQAVSGSGKLIVVNARGTGKPVVSSNFTVNGTRLLTGVAVQGDRALVAGSTEGFTLNPGPALTGKLTLSLLDVSDPLHPALLGSTLVTDYDAQAGAQTSVSTGSEGIFSVHTVSASGSHLILLVDARNPAQLQLKTATVPATVADSQIAGNLLYTTSSSGLSLYDIGAYTGTSVTARVDVPKDSVSAGSYSMVPDQVLSGADRDTLIWNRRLAPGAGETLSWQSRIVGLAPGGSRDAAQGGTVDFVADATPVHLDLPPVTVVSESILGLAPAERTARPGETTTYELTLKNPTTADVTFNLAVQGLPSGWYALSGSVLVPAQGQTVVPLTVRAESGTVTGDYGFRIEATAPGLADAIGGTLGVAGIPLIDAESHGVVVGVTPIRGVAGPGGTATYAVRLTNTGNVSETFDLAATVPAGVSGRFLQNTVTVPPGLDNYREVLLSLAVAEGTAAGTPVFRVSAVSAADPAVADQMDGGLTVPAQGVALAFNPDGSNYLLRVTNTGSAEDTFALQLGGVASPAASLERSRVTLGAGAWTDIPVTMGTIDYAFPGAVDLVALATSQTNTEVRNAAEVSLPVATRHGVSVAFEGAAQTLQQPGAASFLLLVRNTGNTEEAFSAAITGVNGPCTASLRGLDGQPAQTIPVFRLPGLATGAILVNTQLADYGTGSVSVTVNARGQPNLTATATATATANIPPPAVQHLQVTSLTPTASGFKIRFNQAFAPEAINLYETAEPSQGPADVVLQGPGGSVRGSFVADADATGFSFVKTGGLLASGDYAVTLRSASDGFHNAQGMLDGNGDGSEGDAYAGVFNVGPVPAVGLSVPDVVRGPGQRVGAKAKAVGTSRKFLPLILNGGTVKTLRFSLLYDPSKLTITRIKRAASLPGGTRLIARLAQPGRIEISLTSRKPLKPRPRALIKLLATVPATAPYGSAQVLDIDGILANEGALAVADDDGVHGVAYVGDVSGDRRYGSTDVTGVQRFVAGTDGGLSAYPGLDPGIVADVKADGRVDQKDLKRIIKAAKGKRVAEIPKIPKGLP